MTVDPVALSRSYPGALWRNEIRSDRPPIGELTSRVNSRIQRLQKQWQDNLDDRESAYQAARFLEEDQGQWLKKNPGESQDHWNQKPKITVDLANKVLRDVATVYQTSPRRLVTGEASDEQREEAERWLDERVWSFGVDGLDATFLDLDRWLLYHGNVAIEPRYQPGLDGDALDGVEAIGYRRHEFEALSFVDDPRRAEACVFPVRKVDKRNLSQRIVEQSQVYHYWDHEVWARLVDWRVDTSQRIEDDPRMVNGMLIHDFGYLPIIFLRERMVQRCFYSPTTYPNLLRTVMSINKLKTELAYFSMIPGSWWTDQELQRASMGADSITQGVPGQQFDFRRMDADLEGIRANIQREIDDLGVAFGLSPGSLVMDPMSARSGVAIAAEQRDTDALRQERVPKWQRWEERYHRAAIDIYRFMSGEEPPSVLVSDGAKPKAKVEILYQKPRTQMSAVDKREQLQWERDNGLITKEDMLREARSDLTDSEIQDRLERVRAERTVEAPPAPSLLVNGRVESQVD